ncbi:MAG TPA: TIGR04141 family sporadically distributed protein [Candidatus Paceibacterota bacterium]|nr:TIGR04141 family sporadically distributed protein [Candidatus Pacearchaeota archaeon]HRZ50390.1 TIGR04141 family sporadically distributed protein [Candidatus Paceibacterota bacterium]HSA36111.1 TIGR04141 family sporadically distributed protein [Candidatus Paceibacterota bacterium]
MAKYNLYRLMPERRFELVGKLRAAGLESAKKVEAGDCVLEFMYSREPEGSDIWWTKTYKDFFEGVEPPKNVVHCAAFFIYSDTFCYAAALGKTFIQIKNYCDPDFGINMAERIASDHVKIKNSKFYKSRRNRVASTYQAGNRIEFDSGESLDMIRAATIDPALWGAEANFGTAVQFSLDIAPDQLPPFIKRVEEVLNQPARMGLPKVVLIRDAAKLKDLDGALAQALTAGSDKASLIVNDNCQYGIYMQGGYGSQSEKGMLDKFAFRNFLDSQSVNLVEQINDIKVRVYDPEGRERSRNFKAMIDYLDEENRICLIDGKWYRYNQSFLNFLRREADTVAIEKDNGEFKGDQDEFIENQVKAGFTDCRLGIASINEKFRVNKLDLFKDGTLYFVKTGSPESVNYALDQAIGVTKYLQAGRGQIELANQTLDVQKIGLWLASEKSKTIGRLSEVNSLNFLMKIADWKRAVQNAGFRPRVRISQQAS